MPELDRPRSWDEYARSLGAALRSRRLERGITQDALANGAGLTRTHYQQIEHGMWNASTPSNPSLRTILRLAQQLEVDVADLLPDGTSVRLGGD